MMTKTVTHSKVWVGYARKSSDTEDRQVLSIESQVDEIKKISASMGLSPATLDIRTETRTAKKPGRPVWDQLIADVDKNKVNGLIAWHANRLSRNSVDTGQMIYLMDQGKLTEVVTSSQAFRDNPNDKMMLNFFCMVAKYENDNKGIDAQRGLRKKADMGYLPSGAKPGYMNDPHAEKGNKKLFADPMRFPIIKEAWRLMLTGLHTPPRILKIINEQYGYRTPKRKNIGGHPMVRSQMYKMFRDPFYYGRFQFPEGSGQWYDGKYETMITEAEYWKVQELLGRRGMPRPQVHSFTFSGMMQCGFCRALVTAEFKTKRQKNGRVHHYTYYHCTHRKLNTKCTQRAVEENTLIDQISEKLDEVEIPEELHSFAVKWTERENKKEASDYDGVRANLNKQLASSEATADGLIDMRARHEISEDDFKRRYESAQRERVRIKCLIADLAQSNDAWLIEAASDAYRFVALAKKRFKDGDRDVQRAIFGALGSNRTLMDKKLSVDVEETLLRMKKVSLAAKGVHDQVRTAGLPGKTSFLNDLYATSTPLLRAMSEVRTAIRAQRGRSIFAIARNWQ